MQENTLCRTIHLLIPFDHHISVDHYSLRASVLDYPMNSLTYNNTMTDSVADNNIKLITDSLADNNLMTDHLPTYR